MASLALRPISLRMLSASTFKLAETRARIIPVWATSAAAGPFSASDPGAVTWALTFFVIARPPQMSLSQLCPNRDTKAREASRGEVRRLWLGQRGGRPSGTVRRRLPGHQFPRGADHHPSRTRSDGWLGQLAPGSRASDVSLPHRGVASLPPQPPEPQASDEWLGQNAPGSWDSAPR